MGKDVLLGLSQKFGDRRKAHRQSFCHPGELLVGGRLVRLGEDRPDGGRRHLLGRLGNPLPGLDLEGIDWVIVGGESGPGARPIHEEWVLGIRDTCLDAAVPFFFKQWGGTRKKAAGRELEYRTWDQMPCPA